jgi:phytoene synthase
MEAQVEAWEYAVLTMAYEAFKTSTSSLVTSPIASVEGRVYEEAYTYCAQLTRANSRTFYLASRLLPGGKRQAVHALYAFCRATDDIIDQLALRDDAWRLLDDWKARVERPPNAYDPIPLAWADTKARYRIPHGYEAQLIEGIARDLRQQRYPTFGELAEYCYGVASTVGLMVMHIVDFQSEDALPYAVKLGIALQLTNILRDVGVDWQAGRLYLPLEDLTQFGLTEADVERGAVDDHWRAFMQFQIARTRALYAEAERGIALLDAGGRFAIAAAANLYRAILGDIEAHDYDVFHRRAHVGPWGKVRRLPGVWWATREMSWR